MLSFNHYAYGAVIDWVYRHVAGRRARPDAAGLPERRRSPRSRAVGIDWARASVEARTARSAIDWRLEDDGDAGDRRRAAVRRPRAPARAGDGGVRGADRRRLVERGGDARARATRDRGDHARGRPRSAAPLGSSPSDPATKPRRREEQAGPGQHDADQRQQPRRCYRMRLVVPARGAVPGRLGSGQALVGRRVQDAAEEAVDDGLEHRLVRRGSGEQGHRRAQLDGVDPAEDRPPPSGPRWPARARRTRAGADPGRGGRGTRAPRRATRSRRTATSRSARGPRSAGTRTTSNGRSCGRRAAPR